MDSALQLISQSGLKQQLPQFKVGQTVRIHQRITEGDKERIQVFEGIIIKVNHGSSINGSITVRKVVDGIGVERIFSIHSPQIAKIEVTKQAKVRRSKLYFLRERTGKSARLKTTLLEGQVFEPKAAEEEAPEASGEAEPAPSEEAEAPTPEPAAAEEVKTEGSEEAKKEVEETAEAKSEEKAEETPSEEEVKDEEKAEEAPAEEAAEPEEKKEEASA